MNTDIIRKYFSEGPGYPRCRCVRSDDLASLIAGVKSVIFTNTDNKEDLLSLEEMCADLKLKMVMLSKTRGLCGEGRSVDILIGGDPRKLRAAQKSYSDVTSYDWGVALDYPACCVRAYVDWRKQHAGTDLVAHTYANSPKGRAISFLLNNVWNFHSRVIEPGDNDNYFSFRKLNPGLDVDPVIPWHPCSYACPKALSEGRKIYEVMAHYLPGMAAGRRALLGAPVAFWGKFAFAALDGTCVRKSGGFTAGYERLAAPESLLPAAVKKKLGALRELRASAAGAISSSGAPRLPAGGVLLPFSPELPARGRQ